MTAPNKYPAYLNPRVENGTWINYISELDRVMQFRWYYSNADNLPETFQSLTNDCSFTDNTRRRIVETCSQNTTDSDWRIFSSDFNTIYYNPDITYLPWGGGNFSDATFDSVLSNPQPGTLGNSNPRSSELANLQKFVYTIWIDDKGYTGSQPTWNPSPNMDTTGGNSEIDLWDSHIRVEVTNAGIDATKVMYSIQGNNLVRSEINITPPSPRTLQEEKTNIANWYQYYRKRLHVAKAALSILIDQNPLYRYGLGILNYQNPAVSPLRDLFLRIADPNDLDQSQDYIDHNEDLLQGLFDFKWWEAIARTPTRVGLIDAGTYFENGFANAPSPIAFACQRNFTLLVTDGFWDNASERFAPNVGDKDGDGISDTLADIAKNYYDTDLSGLPDIVPTDSFDDNPQQHMNTFGIAFGVEGNLVDTDDDGWPNPALTESDIWGGNPTIVGASSEKIDDLWHAAWNSRAGFYSVRDPAELIEALEEILKDISNVTASGNTVSTSTSVLQSGKTFVYQASFNSGDWSGILNQVPVLDDGNLDFANAISMTEKLDQGLHTDRKILSYNPTDQDGFVLPETLTQASSLLDQDQIDAFGSDGKQDARYEFIRGRGAPYGQNPTQDQFIDSNAFRKRSSKLGDIVFSSPVYVGDPSLPFPDKITDVGGNLVSFAGTPYSSFRNTSRPAILYVGANDGMLHAFNVEIGHSDFGKEVFAYMPSAAYKNLATLSDPQYEHESFVDGTPTVSDAYFDGAWHTVLIGGLRTGGRGIYALDVTDPNNPAVLWEFNDSDSPDLGLTFGEPAVAKIGSEWYALFGNGYNSGTGKVVLYVVSIEPAGSSNTPKTVNEIQIPGTTSAFNGLSSPAVVDVNEDFDADFAYAGDLEGNLYKFDLTSGTGSISSSYPKGILFKAESSDAGNPPQPITSRPQVDSHHLFDGYIVYFGTGKYIENGIDNIGSGDTQTFYAVWDREFIDSSGNLDFFGSGGGTLDRNDLLKQEIISESSNTRVTSDNPIFWDNPHLGWFLDLFVNGFSSNRGEKQISDSLLRNKQVVFTTLIPSDDICDPGGDSWIMALDATDGSPPDTSPFDFNNDDVINDADMIDTDGDGIGDTVGSGLISPVGISSTPDIITNPDGTNSFYTTGSDQAVPIEEEIDFGPEDRGRQSWRQLTE